MRRLPESRRQKETKDSSAHNANDTPILVTPDSIYEYYSEHIGPAFLASLPILGKRMLSDMRTWSVQAIHEFYLFLLPKWKTPPVPELPNLRQLWEQTATLSPPNMTDYMIQHFDTNGDGHISPNELLNMTEILKWAVLQEETWWSWFSREWPLMDWKVGLFLWRTFGGMLLLTAALTIIPGRTHAVAARILRWPVLGLTYFLIGVELMVYIVIRLGIRIAEDLVARPKHARLRRRMAAATSYEEWVKHATALDQSQGRDKWLRTVDDHTSYRYNWGFIQELISDMRIARHKGDSLHALAVIQQCTRKNVGGVMSEDLFSYSNTGAPKAIVEEFIQEVVTTLNWLTDEALNVEPIVVDDSLLDRNEREAKERYEERLQSQLRNEKQKLWGSLVSATISFLGHNNDSNHDRGNSRASEESTSGSISTVSSQDDQEGKASTTPDSPKQRKRAGSALPAFHREEVLAFLKRARAAYGRTAMCLSGGAMMGLYHFGHILGLLEVGLLPHIISGTSAGAVVGSIVCTRTDEELRRDLRPDVLSEHLTCFARPWGERIKSVLRNGHLFALEDWMELIKWFTCGDMTFEEAYKKTGRVFCITLSSTTKKAPPVLLNYLTAPNVTVASAVVASAAVPGFVPPVRLQYKDADGVVRTQGGEKDETYFDGSIKQDIPIGGLTEIFNTQFFIACQANPHIVPFFYSPRGTVGRPCRWSSGTQESSWRGGFLLAALEMYLKNDMKAKMVFLNELEAAVGFTSTMMTQEYVGSTTIVPQVSFFDYFKLFTDPRPSDLDHYFHCGAIASYEHAAMIKLHYSLADTLEECVSRLESGPRRRSVKRRSTWKKPNVCEDVLDGVWVDKKSVACDKSPNTLAAHVMTKVLREETHGDRFQTDQETSDDDDDEYQRDWVNQ